MIPVVVALLGLAVVAAACSRVKTGAGGRIGDSVGSERAWMTGAEHAWMTGSAAPEGGGALSAPDLARVAAAEWRALRRDAAALILKGRARGADYPDLRASLRQLTVAAREAHSRAELAAFTLGVREVHRSLRTARPARGPGAGRDPHTGVAWSPLPNGLGYEIHRRP